jgi:chromosome segregation ATPase
MVEDIHSNERSLSEELTSTKHRLSETTNECSALREHIRTLETTQNTQLRQSVEEAVNHIKADLQRAHTSELGKQQETIHNLQKRNEELASRIMAAEDDKDRTHAAETQSMESGMRNLQHSLESLQRELKMKDEDAVRLERENGELKGQIAHLEEDSRLLAEGGTEAGKRLLADVNYYREQLEDGRRTLAERDGQITQLQSSQAETENLLICAQSSVDEKDTIIADLQRRGSGSEERNASLEARLIDMEREVAESKNSAEHVIEVRIKTPS